MPLDILSSQRIFWRDPRKFPFYFCFGMQVFAVLGLLFCTIVASRSLSDAQENLFEAAVERIGGSHSEERFVDYLAYVILRSGAHSF
jgi:hypothetical protein